ncbi:MAG: PQQ-binding-like beta-propeller repeat protein [Bryobacteraceae bacterium]
MMETDMTGNVLTLRQSLLFLLLLTGFGASSVLAAGQDWTEFGGNAQSSSASNAPTGITAKNVASLKRRQVKLDGTVDSTAIYLHNVTVKGSSHDVFFVTTTYGKTIAVDAANGGILWEYTPSKYSSWEGTRQITNSTPAAGPGRRYIYAASPDGVVQKLAVSNGHVGWRTPVTRLAHREKITSGLKIFHGHLIVVVGGYIGDRPPYQGHVAILDAKSGKLLHVWNSLCSNRTGLLQPSSCSATRSSIWGRGGATIDPKTGDIFVASGNGPYNGKTNWSDALIELNASATRMLGNYTPSNNSYMNERDLDMGSTSPALLGDGIVAQGGKDAKIVLLKISQIAGTGPHQDHELQVVSTPGSDMLFSDLAVWRHNGETWVFAADKGGTEAWTFSNDKLTGKWKNGTGGTSPLVAGGLLYVYDPAGGLDVYDPASGKHIADLSCGPGHWNSPIVADGKIALPEGNANHHASSGILDIWSLPSGH